MAQNKIACITIDLEPDFLSESSHDVFLNVTRFNELKKIYLHNNIPLTVFVVGKMLDERMPVREKFDGLDVEFELHSYSHSLNFPDSLDEIVRGKDAYYKYFGQDPRGYRAPNGAISPSGLAVLHREKFQFDSSIFPANRPELGYNHSDFPCTPFIFSDFPGLIEVPMAVIPKIRIIISMSFLKLFGINFYRLMFRLYGLPDTIVFDSHLYDFYPTSPVLGLSRLDWRRYTLLRHQKKALYLFQSFLNLLSERGYKFLKVCDLIENLENNNSCKVAIKNNFKGQ